ncbi:hypothetical protein J2751_001255 [Halorubrum alkaliphilum]|uniref:PGF-CTERM sorting domain-containing protein n=1 Tax=Halorubrum alkaliphilum TaxID=261290 RepID=A0A8T4GET6_9EURY|nr:Hvo_1808 family surface protein [Halorubrum alkaliphilum]MBP1922249.1 hypothetical protein [Halorubrum alkaliphilum]
MRRVLTLSVVVVTVALLAIGTGAAAVGGAAVGGEGSASTNSVAETAAECETTDDNDLIGCWNGTHYGDDFDIDQGDGLTEPELEALTHRKMARVEHLRERPFKEEVTVDTITREEFQADRADDGEPTDADREFNRWNDQVWKALFVVGEDDSSAEAIDAVFGGAVGGFYSPAEERVVIVVDEGEALQIDGSTLVHELAHAMQDQYHDLGDRRYVGDTQDADLAVDGIVEGEVVHLEELYDERCEENWTCLGEPDEEAGGGAGDLNFGILQTVLQPYSDGPFYAAELVEERGWEAVNDTMNEPPESTSEVIHRDPDYETTDVEFEDTAEGDWETYSNQGVDGAETTGEASMFVMFWYQAYQAVQAGEPSPTFDANTHLATDETLATRNAYNYAHSSTDGWAGDELYPYRNDAGDEERDGYVWVTEWQTEADAEEFHETYLRMVDHHGAERLDDGVLDVADGDFRGAYGIERDDTTVTIAHAPTADGVFDLRPELDPDGVDDVNGENAGDGLGSSDPNLGDGNEGDGEGDDEFADGEPFDGAVPGLGVVVGLVSLVGAALLARRSRS